MKGQGAVEFLLTHSWSLLVVLVILSFLVLIGLPNLRDAEPERCHFTVGSVGCESYYIGKGGTGGSLAVKELEVSNGFSRRIYVCGLVCSAQASPSGISQPACGNKPAALIIEAGSSRRIVSNWVMGGSSVPCIDENGVAPALAVNDLYRGKLYMLYSYEHETSGNAHVATGELVARVGRG